MRHLFSTKIKIILVLAVLLAVALGIEREDVPDYIAGRLSRRGG